MNPMSYQPANTNVEKRAYKRIRRGYMFQYRINPQSTWDAVVMHDLSAGGMAFNCGKTIENDAILDVKINFPSSNRPIECAGRVVRSRKDAYLPMYHIALSFMDIADDAKNHINKLAEEFHAKERL
ncbi:MAG: PilZ domain-containing protein [Candidatus Omnitrophota bacterium]